jgi:hypothetical protein
MNQSSYHLILTFLFTPLIVSVSVPESPGAQRRDYVELSTTIVSSRSTARERMRRAGRDTTANEVLDSILARPKVRWRRADLAVRLKHGTHLNAAEVPGFPNDDPKLMDPRNWPASMTIEGGLCSLTAYAYDGHQSSWSRSVEDSDATVFSLYYTDAGADFHSHYVRKRGPYYDWLKGRLRSRSWHKGRGSRSRVRSYWPYPSGELFTFMEFEKKYDAQENEVSMEWIEEVFARDGTLIGCCSGPVDRSGVCSGYWMGVDVGRYFLYQWMEALERSLVQR